MGGSVGFVSHVMFSGMPAWISGGVFRGGGVRGGGGAGGSVFAALHVGGEVGSI